MESGRKKTSEGGANVAPDELKRFIPPRLQGEPSQGGGTFPFQEKVAENRAVWASRCLSEAVAGWRMIRHNRVSFLLLTLPLAPLSVHRGWTDTMTFVCNFLPLVPLSAVLGDFTQVIAEKLGSTTGGFVSASLGNTGELVFAFQALRANQLRVVQISLLGSVLSNLLLVLGTAFFAGGLFSGKKQQSFSSVSAVANTSLLLLSCLSLGAPTPIASYADVEDRDVLMISRIISVFLLSIYAQLMVFQFKTHSFLSFKSAREEDRDDQIQDGDDNDNDKEENHGSDYDVHRVRMHPGMAVIGLAIFTTLIASLCGNLVGSIDGFTEESHVPRAFTCFILVPIIGNVTEHLVATSFAVKDKMDLAMGIAVGSATQASLFVFPSTILIAWAMDRDLTLMFPKYDLFIYLMSVMIVAHLVNRGTSNWMEGSTLVTSYVVIGMGYWFLPPSHDFKTLSSVEGV